jgi:mono/diheme cytochrome c family protein
MMNRRAAAIFVLLMALAPLGGCREGERAKDQWPISERELTREPAAGAPGETHYRRYCTGCHGADGKGNGGLTGADFTKPDSALLTRTDAELIESVRNGKRGVTSTMPAHSPVLSDAEIAAVVSFVRARFTPAAVAPAPSEADTGAAPARAGSTTGAAPAPTQP